MKSNAEINCKDNPKIKEKIFFLCEECMWGVTSLDKSRIFEIIGEEGTCPVCHQDQLSSFPLMMNDCFTYQYSEKRGIEVEFRIKSPIKQIS